MTEITLYGNLLYNIISKNHVNNSTLFPGFIIIIL